MRHYLFRVLFFLLGLIHVQAQNCSNAVDTVYAHSTAATCGQSNGTVVIDSVRKGTSPLLYSLNSGTYQSSNVFTGLNAGSYTISVKDDSNCVYNYPVAIVVVKTYGPSQSTVSSTPVSVCNASDGTITVTPGGGTAPYTYQLNNNSPQSSNTFTSLGAGSYTIQVEDAQGCDTVLYIAIQDPNGIQNAWVTGGTSSVCGGNTGSFTAQVITGGPAVSYQLGNGPQQASPTFTGLASGLYDVTFYDANNCKYTAYNIWVDQLPGPSITSSTITNDICNKQVGAIAINTVSGGTAPYTYAINNGSFSSLSTFSSLAAGTYTISIKDANGCLEDISIDVPLTPGPTDITASITHSDCGADNGKINSVSVIDGTAPFTYSWSSGQSSQNLNNIPPGTYTLTVTDGNQCAFSKSFTVNEINQITDVTATITNVVCSSSFGSIEITNITGGSAPYRYSKNGGGSFQSTPIFSNLSIGTYIILVKDQNGCVLEVPFTVDKMNDLTCSSSSDADQNTIYTGDEVTLTGTGSGAINYWSANTGANDTIELIVQSSPPKTDVFLFTTASAEGCTKTCPITIIVIPKIIPYDFFSPNGDGKNDKWKIGFIQYFKDAEVSVYTRWGQRVFHSKGYNEDSAWDGTNSGLSLETATYYYIIDLNSGSENEKDDIYKGSVTIVR